MDRRRQLLYYVNLIRACKKVLYQLVYIGQKFVFLKEHLYLINQKVPKMWKNGLFTMWFNQRYNCQTSHYLGRNRLPKPFLILPSLVIAMKIFGKICLPDLTLLNFPCQIILSRYICLEEMNCRNTKHCTMGLILVESWIDYS
jgi:hypothetical protein